MPLWVPFLRRNLIGLNGLVDHIVDLVAGRYLVKLAGQESIHNEFFLLIGRVVTKPGQVGEFTQVKGQNPLTLLRRRDGYTPLYLQATNAEPVAVILVDRDRNTGVCRDILAVAAALA